MTMQDKTTGFEFLDIHADPQFSTNLHHVKGIHIQNFSGLYFPAFGLNKDQKPVNTDIFYSVLIYWNC